VNLASYIQNPEHKPFSMPVVQFANCLAELNDYIPYLPGSNNEDAKMLTEGQMRRALIRGMLAKWQQYLNNANIEQ
jgi:hypothetical protein